MARGTNAALATPFSNVVDSAIVKIDHNFNPSNMLTGRYYIGDSDQSSRSRWSAGIATRTTTRLRHAGTADIAFVCFDD